MAKLSSLLPLIILFLVLAFLAFVGYSIYTWSNELAERGKASMEKKNMSFTKEGGLRVGVKGLQEEGYADRTQNVLVNVWNQASFPAYKSALGWGQSNTNNSNTSTSGARPSVTKRTSSSGQQAQGQAQQKSSGASLAPPAASISAGAAQRRSASPLPGAFE